MMAIEEGPFARLPLPIDVASRNGNILEMMRWTGKETTVQIHPLLSIADERQSRALL
jgi:hypothetical protein